MELNRRDWRIPGHRGFYGDPRNKSRRNNHVEYGGRGDAPQQFDGIVVRSERFDFGRACGVNVTDMDMSWASVVVVIVIQVFRVDVKKRCLDETP